MEPDNEDTVTCDVCKHEILDDDFVWLSFQPVKRAHKACAPDETHDNTELFRRRRQRRGEDVAPAEEFPEFLDDDDFFDSVTVIGE